jgi:hypothetical protein
MPRSFCALSLLACLAVAILSPPVRSAEVSVSEDRAVENLAAFARVYGYVRFFHPTEAAARIDWDQLAMVGAEAVREARDDAALRLALRELFLPIGQGLDFFGPDDVPPAPVIPRDESLTYWRHLGVRLSDQSNIYRSTRAVATPGETAVGEPSLAAPYIVEKEISPQLRLRLPLAVSASGEKNSSDPAALSELEKRIAALNPAQSTPSDWRVRAAGVIVAWNVFQHFHPYIDRIGVDWLATLRPTLRRALRDRTRDDHYATLSELVAKLEDGHGYIYGSSPAAGLPIRVAYIEGQILVSAVAEGETTVRRGDILLRIDDTPVLDHLRELEHYISGSPHLRRHRALNQWGEGSLGSTARIELLREGRKEEVSLERTARYRGFFFKPILEFDHPPFAELRAGIFYINLSSFTVAQLAEKLPQLEDARGIIFDNRPSGKAVVDRTQYIQPTRHIIPHLIDAPVNASPMLIPQVTRPDRDGWTYRESTWPVNPKAPRLKAPVVFINVPSVVSYGETCMAIIAHHKLATLVGESTAGCNGNANFILLPGGLRIMWTGMEVLKHDRTPFYGTGFAPDHAVTRTLAAAKEGRDEFLEKALVVLPQ